MNPVAFFVAGPFATGWILVWSSFSRWPWRSGATPCNPAACLEAVLIGMTNTETSAPRSSSNFPVILLLMFMVAGIYFMRGAPFLFTKILLGIRSKLLSMFSISAAFLSAFLDTLTVTAVVISTPWGSTRSTKVLPVKVSTTIMTMARIGVGEIHREDLDDRSFLRSLMMHAAVGTALGGVCTTVGDPKSAYCGEGRLGIRGFFMRMAPVTMPVLVVGLVTCLALELTGAFGYGAKLPVPVRKILEDYDAEETKRRTPSQVARLLIQGAAAIILIVALAMHWAEVGLIGLMVIVIQTAFNGVIEEHQLGKAFEEALPFTALLVVFFSVVAVIHDQHLFTPVISWVLAQKESLQPGFSLSLMAFFPL